MSNAYRFTKEQRLLARLLSEIHQKMDIKDGINSALLSEALRYGHDWAIKGIVPDSSETSNGVEEKVEFVHDVLGMCRHLDSARENFSNEEKELLQAKEINLQKSTYEGFDGNNDDEYNIAEFILNKLNLYSELTSLNSHSIGTKDTYRKMLEIYTPINTFNSKDGKALSFDQYSSIVNWYDQS